MAVDTREKRASAYGSHWHPLYPLADSTVDANDRQQCAGVYSGVGAREPSTATTIEQALYYLLATDGLVNSLVNGRVYPSHVPQGAAMPAITYSTLSTGRDYVIEGRAQLAAPNFEINCWAESYSETKSVAETVRSVLNGWGGMVGSISINVIMLTGQSDVFANIADTKGLRRFGKSQDYIIWWTEYLS